MAHIEIVPFSDEHLDGAGRLLAARHDRHREAEPLLPQVDAREAVEHVWRQEGVSGAAAVRDGRVVGYLFGQLGDSPIWGHHAWVERAGHAATSVEVTRDLYAAAAARWGEAGATRHYVLVPALGFDLDPWYRLGFGHMHVEAIRESGGASTALPEGMAIRRGGRADLESAIRIDALIYEHQLLPPSFGIVPRSPDVVRADWIETLEDPQVFYFVVERDGEVVGHSTLYPPEPEFAVPSDAIYLASTATDPRVRGEGIGRALTEHVLRWARERGHGSVVTNWRMTNLLASRFWPARGFRPVYHRLHRIVGVG